jgi:hypothetical protein
MRSFPVALAGLVCSTLASVSSATVLTFDDGLGTPSPVPSNYGNRVGDPNTFQPPQFHYGSAGGITPNVNVYYEPVLRMGGTSNPVDPTHIFGDLTDVIYRDSSSGTEPGILSITFFADPGYQVCLDSFDMAASYNSITGQGEDLFMKSLKIVGQGGTILYGLDFNPADSDPNSPTTTLIPGTLPLRHRHFDFESSPLCSQTVTIRIDLNNYITIGGSKVDRFAIDNIKFHQTPSAPTPGAGALLAVAACVVGFRRRRARA